MKSKIKRDIKKAKSIIVKFLEKLDKGSLEEISKLIKSLETFLADEYKESNLKYAKFAFYKAKRIEQLGKEILNAPNERKIQEIKKLVNEIMALEDTIDKSITEEEKINLREADTRLSQITKESDLFEILTYTNPTNAKEEKEKFFASLEQGRSYNPQFEYKKRPNFNEEKIMEETKKIVRTLREMNIDFSEGLGKIFEKKRYDLMLKIKLVRSIGTRKITKYSSQLYGKPSLSLVRKAIRICNSYKAEVQEKKPYDAKKTKKELEKSLKEYGLETWKVEIEEVMSANASVNAGKELIKVREDANFSESDIKRLIVHEIGVHAIRAKSGEESGFKIFKTGTTGYLPTEEGLATYREKEVGIVNPSQTQEYAARTLAVKFALHYSFYDVFRKLKFYGFDDKTAYKTTQRAKRGLSDTSKPGGFIKDHVYILGGKLIDRFIEAGHNIKDLEKGKIGVNDIPLLLKNPTPPPSPSPPRP